MQRRQSSSKWVVVAATLFMCTVGARGAPPIVGGGEKILWIGNSFTEWAGGLDSYVKAALAAGEPSRQVYMNTSIMGATELIEIYNNGSAVAEIRRGNYDVVVLQGFNNPHNVESADRETFVEAVRNFDAVIKETGAQTVLFMTWPYQTHAETPFLYTTIASVISQSYLIVGEEVGAPVVPCGWVWNSLFRAPPPGQDKFFLYADVIHQNQTGAYLNALAFYSILTLSSPKELDFSVDGFSPPAELDSVLKYRAWTICKKWIADHGYDEGATVGIARSTPTAISPAAGVEPGTRMFSLNGALIGSAVPVTGLSRLTASVAVAGRKRTLFVAGRR